MAILKAETKKKLKRIAAKCTFFGLLTAIGVAGGVTGLIFTTGTLLKIACVSSIALSGIWGYLTGRGVYKVVKEITEPAKSTDTKKQHKQKYKTALGERKELIKDKRKERKTADASAKLAIDAQLKSVPSKPTAYKFNKGMAITGAVLSMVLTIFSGATLFVNYNSADTFANEAGVASEEYLDKQGAVNQSFGVGIALTSAIGAVGGAVTAGKARKRREQEIIDYDYTH